MGSLSGRRIMVTSGGTREYIDEVRVVTNVSTGALGAIIAQELLKRGANVFYVHGKQAHMPNYDKLFDNERNLLSCHGIVTVKDLMETMHTLIDSFGIDSVVHLAAVSDFTFKNTKGIKLSSSSKEDFIEFLGKTIRTTPKIIKKIKKWNPDITLVGFKFTVGKNMREICDIACDSLKKNGADLVVANDKKEMSRLGEHRAYLINSTDTTYIYHTIVKESVELTGSIFTRNGKEDIASGIADFLGGNF